MRHVGLTLAIALLAGQGVADETEKLSDDPTKVITRLGLSYADLFSLDGSLAFGPTAKLNGSVSDNGEWRFGGSYLFRWGIVNVAASRKQLSTGVEQTQYSIGSYLPLSVFGVDTGRWQVFPAFGANYTEGQAGAIDESAGDDITFSVSSKGGYFGSMALLPLSQRWTFKVAAMLSAGSDDYSGFGIGGGFTYNFSDKDSLRVFGSYSDNSYGVREKFGIGYRHEF